MAAALAFIDTETTGLDPDRHEVWEVAVVVRRPGAPAQQAQAEYRWLLPVDLSRADPVALKIGGYHQRHWRGYEVARSVVGKEPHTLDGATIVQEHKLPDFAWQLAYVTRGCHLVGAVPSFDEERLRRLLRKHGALPEWHYQVIDVEALAAAWLSAHAFFHQRTAQGDPDALREAEAVMEVARPPWDSDQLSKEVGVDPNDYERHTALGDAHWAMAIYDKVMGAPLRRGPRV